MPSKSLMSILVKGYGNVHSPVTAPTKPCKLENRNKTNSCPWLTLYRRLLMNFENWDDSDIIVFQASLLIHLNVAVLRSLLGLRGRYNATLSGCVRAGVLRWPPCVLGNFSQRTVKTSTPNHFQNNGNETDNQLNKTENWTNTTLRKVDEHADKAINRTKIRQTSCWSI